VNRPAFDLSLYLVVGPADCRGRPLEQVVAAALAGGVTLVQLRDKTASEAEFLALGRALLPLCRAAGVPLIVNDHLEAALALGAEGLHLGQDDSAVAEARTRLGPDRLLGVSAGSPAELAAVPQELVDYLGVGPVHATGSKADAGAAIGPEGVAAVRVLTDLPLVGIGGLTAARAPAVIRAGARGVAVVSAIAGAEDPEAAARELRRAVDLSSS